MFYKKFKNLQILNYIVYDSDKKYFIIQPESGIMIL